MKHKGLFFFILFLIIILGGVIFYFGWVQIQLEENTYAVIFTKLHGYEDEVVTPGVFLWRWDRLIPTNMTLHRFTVTPQEKSISLSGTLPSAEVYTTYLEGSPDFSYDISFRVAFTVRPEALPDLLREHHVTPDTIGSWYEDVFSRCLTEGTAMIESRLRQASSGDSPELLQMSLGQDLRERLADLFPMLDVHSVTPETMRLPDFDLYRRGKDMYMALMTEKQESEAGALRQSSEFFVTESVRLDMLKKYGELLTEYPVLLDYMKISGITDLRDIDVQDTLSDVD